MFLEQIRARIAALPETAVLPELVTIFERTGSVPHPDWEIPLAACQVVGGERATALPGAAALACLQISIILVDDILDDDPRGEHLRRGVGATANLAQAFQAAAFELVGTAEVSGAQKAAAGAVLARAALATAAGQQLDVQNLSGEDNYWRVVRAKSTPFYGAAYELGAILGGAETAVAQELYHFGVLVGEMIQIEDDLKDALEKPANADWQQGRNNLLILYARTADHPQRERFEALLPLVADAARLEEAQQLLAGSGALSYAAYQLVERYQKARQLVQKLALPDPAPLQEMLQGYGEGWLTHLLQSGGEAVSPEILRQSLAPKP